MIDRELRDEKAVKVAVNHLYEGRYVIEIAPEEEPVQAEAAGTAEADGE